MHTNLSPSPIPGQQSDALGQLHALMTRDGVSEWGVRRAVAIRGYASLKTPVADYDQPLLGKIVTHWDTVLELVREKKAADFREGMRKIELKELFDECGAVDLDYDADKPEEIDWIVKNVIAPHSPVGIGGGEKSHKSTIATELALIASSSDFEEPGRFLNQFKGPEYATSVIYLNLEGTDGEFRDRLRRIEKARGLRANRDFFHVLQRFPPLNTDFGLGKLESLFDLSDESGGLIVVDSLYVALAGSDFTRQSIIGGHLADISEICHKRGMTPIYVHHFKAGGRSGLDAFTGTGLQQHVGQWLLLHKTGRYDAEAGHQRYRMEIGGRHGGGGVYSLNVTEGRLSDAGGRYWETAVTTHVKAESNLCQAASSSKLAKAVLTTIQSNQGITLTRLGKEIPKRSASSLKKAVESLLQNGTIIEAEVVNRGHVAKGYFTPDESPDSPPTVPRQIALWNPANKRT